MLGLLEAARDGVRAQADFVATVSHELRTPLASIRLLAETLELRLTGNPEARDYPARIVREAENLTFLVENVLSFNRFDKGRWKLQAEQVRVGEVAASLRQELAVLPEPVELLVEGEQVVVGVLAVPADAAQEVADRLVKSGVKIIFNYSERLLQVPPDVTVHTSSPAVDLLYALYFYLT